MQQTRETIALALFNQLKVISFDASASGGSPAQTFQTTARKGRIWTEVPDAAQPAMFLFQIGEVGSQKNYGLYKWHLHFWCLIYLKADASDADAGTTVETTINNVLDAIEKALQPVIGTINTLGLRGITNAWIDGQVSIDTGVLDQQCAIVIPITVEAGS